MDPYAKNRQSCFLPEGVLAEMRAEAARLERPLSWVVQSAWLLAKAEIKKFPSMPDQLRATEAEIE